MSGALLIKGLLTLLFSGVFAWMVFDREGGDTDGARQKYLPYISGLLLPALLLMIVACELIFFGWARAVQLLLGFFFGVFLHICLYYLLLMPALPLLRRHISARACAVLWMLPNYLYLTQMNYMRLPEPRWMICAPATLVGVLLALWLAGFLGVLGWKVFAHLRFRAQILRGAVPVTDPAVLEIWRREVEAARFRKPRFKLVCSPKLRTPLSVGLFRRSVRVVLPARDYTQEELALVFRHELVHIGREDAWSKFFLVFCSAVCWFNPLMWMAMEKSAEDLELSCDETVLLDAGEGTRHQYAQLLLKTAGDERGFTTCLSASAEALRYRLKNVMAPKKKASGALAVGLVFFLLCMSCGYVTLAYGEGRGAALIYQSRNVEAYSLRGIRQEEDTQDGSTWVCTDEQALHKYLSGLRMERVMGNYSFDLPGLTIMLDTPDGLLVLTLSDRFITLLPLYGESGGAGEAYYLPDGADWDALGACITQAPGMTVHLSGGEAEYGQRDFPMSLQRLSLVGQEDAALYEATDSQPNGIYGYSASQALFSSEAPFQGSCQVEIAPLDGGEKRSLSLDAADMCLELPEEAARYTVRGEFRGQDGRLYRAEYQFEIGDI